ncbi:MAG: hypothetical protein U0X91_03235 [Spirosomataceae bacterium]
MMLYCCHATKPVKFNNYVRPYDAFRRSFKRLEGGFITQETYNPVNLKFINPSLVDFLIDHLRGNYDEIIRMSESAFFLVQLTARIFPLHLDNNQHLSVRLKEKLLQQYDYFIKPESQNHDRVILIIILTKNFKFEKVEDIVIQLFLQIEEWYFLADTYSERTSLIDFLEEMTSERAIDLIGNHGLNMFAELILSDNNLEDLTDLLDMIFGKFKASILMLFEQDDFYGFSDHISGLLNEKIEKDIEDLLGYSHAQDFVDEKEEAIQQMIDKFNSFGLNVSANLSNYGSYNWWEIGSDNYFNEQMAKDD